MPKANKDKNNKINWLWRLIEASPISLPAALAVFGCVAIVFLLIGQLRNELVWPVGLVLSVLAVVFVTHKYKVEQSDRAAEQRIVTLLVLIGVISWTAWNSLYTSQTIYVYRDPAIYAVTGAELVDNNDLFMKASNVFGDNPDIRGDSGAFRNLTSDSERIYPQGLHLLPVLLGLAGRIGGEPFMLHVNPLFGGLALLAMYGLARIFIKPKWAALAVLAFSLMLPLIYFSRDTYTEPLAATLVFGGLSLIFLAQKTKNKALWFLGGIVGGSGTLVRVDAFLVVAGLIVFAWVFLALAKSENRKARLLEIIWFQLGLAIASIIGWLDVTRLSALYYTDLRSLILQQVLLMAAALLGGLVLVVTAWKTGLWTWLNKKTHEWRAITAVGTLLGGVLVLLSRPLWYTSYTEGPSTFLAFLANLQIAEGRPVEPRNYIEQSANWVWWYTGPVVALLGVIGLGMSIYYLANAKKKYVEMLPFIIVFGVTALTYLVNPSIAPDQIWAVRRYLPVIFPGLLIFAALALQKSVGFISSRGLNRRATIMIAVVIFLAGPVFISYPFLRTRTYTPLLSQVYEVCDSLPDNAAVLLVGTLSYSMLQTIRTYCDVPTAERLTEPSVHALKDAAKAANDAGLYPIILVDAVEKTIVPGHEQLTEVGNIRYTVVASSLYHPPRSEVKNDRSIYLGVITDNGAVAPIK